MSAGEFSGEVPTVQLDPGRSAGEVEAIRQAVMAGGPAFFPRHRWFGDKARAIAETGLISVVSPASQDDSPNALKLTMIDVVFTDGGRERYFVPLIVSPGATVSSQSLACMSGPGGETFILDDAVSHASFHRWLLNPVTTTSGTENTGQIIWRPGPGYGAAVANLGDVSSRVSGAEQSNSAVIFGTDLLVKVFRKLRPGLNPDIEISRFLSAQAEFRNFPDLLGDLTFGTNDGAVYSIGMALPFIPNDGDAWAHTQRLLGDMLLGGTGADPVAPFHLLGVRTGQLHRALATRTVDPAFAAEPITAVDVDRWTEDLKASVERTLALVQARTDQLPSIWRTRLADLSPGNPAVVRRIEGFKPLQGVDKIRVHGDYHLGQILVTLDHDFVILDFEGEPSRPMAERRAKTSPLKDVAGMLRSLSYARFAALRAKPDGVPERQAALQLVEWERNAGEAFLSGYRTETAERGAGFLPGAEADFSAALSAWLLDKAIYEVNYEINNRPDWLPLPLEALLTAET